MRVEAVNHEGLFAGGVGVHGPGDVRDELRFGTGRLQRWADDHPRHHVHTSRQRGRHLRDRVCTEESFPAKLPIVREERIHEGAHGFEIVAVNAEELPGLVERLGESYFEGPR